MRRKITYDPDRDYYTLLDIGTYATADEVRQAYRRCVREVHPDLNQDRAAWATEQLQLINEAYTVLSDPSLRKDYDRLRWPHIPHSPRTPSDSQWGSTPRPRGGTGTPTYDFSQPWWEQAARQAPSGFADPDLDSNLHVYYTDGMAPRPVWMIIADWLEERGLASLEGTWLLLVGLWRSPYAGLLIMLGLALTLNVGLIVFAFAEPDAWNEVQAWFEPDGDDQVYTPPVYTPTPTLAVLNRDCDDPRMRIIMPVSLEILGDEFSIYGTVQHPDLWSYEIMMGYLGQTFRTTDPRVWKTVRPEPPNQVRPEHPIVEGMLTDTPVDLTNQPPGYYAIRLRVTLGSGAILEPCDVLVQR